MHFSATELIPLQSFDVFWRKLDIEPSIVVQDVDNDFDNEVQNFKRNFEKQSTFGKFSFLKMIKAIYESKTTLVDEPEYHKNNRGRPSLKQTQKNIKKLRLSTQDPPNTSSVVWSEMFDLYQEPVRHSMYVNQTYYSNQPYYPDPFMNTSQPYYAGLLTNEKLDYFHPYITHVQNVIGDGNCGFKTIAACLGHDEGSWRQIRMDLFNKLSMNNTIYTSLFTKDGLQLLQNTLNHFEEGFATKEHWMYMPETCLLIVSRYNVVVIFLSKQGNTMCLPLCSSPLKSQPPYICAIASINDNHFVKLELQGDFPIPSTHPQWSYYAFDPTWENPYFHRQNMYNQLNRNSECAKTRINVED